MSGNFDKIRENWLNRTIQVASIKLKAPPSHPKWISTRSRTPQRRKAQPESRTRPAAISVEMNTEPINYGAIDKLFLTWSSPVLPCQPSCDTSGTAYMGTTPPYLSQRDSLSSAAHGQILHGHPGLISPPLFLADNLSKTASSGRCFLWLPVLDSIIPYHSQLLCWGRY